MNAFPPNFTLPDDSSVAARAVTVKWTALHEAAGVVALLAGLPSEAPHPAARSFPVLIGNAGGWRLATAEQGIDDLAAIMEAGITALLAVHTRGANAAAPAMALWHEFREARDGLLKLLPH